MEFSKTNGNLLLGALLLEINTMGIFVPKINVSLIIANEHVDVQSTKDIWKFEWR